MKYIVLLILFSGCINNQPDRNINYEPTPNYKYSNIIKRYMDSIQKENIEMDKMGLNNLTKDQLGFYSNNLNAYEMLVNLWGEIAHNELIDWSTKNK